MTHILIETIVDGIREVADVPNEHILSAATEFERDLGFDSGNFIELFVLLEERVPGFTLGPTRPAREDFHSVERLALFIEAHLALKLVTS